MISCAKQKSIFHSYHNAIITVYNASTCKRARRKNGTYRRTKTFPEKFNFLIAKICNFQFSNDVTKMMIDGQVIPRTIHINRLSRHKSSHILNSVRFYIYMWATSYIEETFSLAQFFYQWRSIKKIFILFFCNQMMCWLYLLIFT